MGGVLAKCLGPSAPPTVFTICPSDGKAHDFGDDAKAGQKITDRDRFVASPDRRIHSF